MLLGPLGSWRAVIRMALTVGPQGYKKLTRRSTGRERRGREPATRNFMTMTRFILTEQRKSMEATGELSQLLYGIQIIIKSVASTVRKLGLGVLTGQIQKESKSGDIQQLQIYSHELFLQVLSGSYSCCLIASEIQEETILVDTERQGKYIVVFDPLDGKGKDPFNIFGSIFGIYRRPDVKLSEKSLLQPGREMVAAGYALYGSATCLILCLRSTATVNGFVLDPSVGEFYLCDPNMKIPQASETYSINEGYTANWDDAIQEFVMRKKNPKQKKVYSCRYIGTLIADAHRILKHGGIFLYPQTKEHPTGKLKLLFKCNPLAFIMEHAGGTASNGKSPILDIVPEKQSQKSPFYVGCHSEMTSLLQIIASHRRHGPKGQI